MSSKRIKRQVEELEKDHRIAVKSQNFGKQSEIELELAELLKDGDPQKSIEYYKCALKSSKAAKDHENTILAYRNLGELCISVAEDEEDYRKGINYLKRQLNVAEEAKEHGFIQLALHTLAQNYNSEASRFSDESINLAAALSYGRRCINYLNKHERNIEENKDAIKTGENSSRRRAGIQSVLADIFIKFGAIKKATEHINSATEYGLKNVDRIEHLFLYRCYFVKLEILHGPKCMSLLETVKTYATKHKIKENSEILERKYLMQSVICNPNDKFKFCDSIEYFLKQYERKDNEYKDFVNSVLVFFSFYVDMKKNLSNTVTNHERSVLYEDLGDKACNAEFFEFGMDFYMQMLKYAEAANSKERIYLACGSIVETARNLHDYKLAHTYQERAYKLVQELYPTDVNKIFFDECDLFYLDVRNGYNAIAKKDQQYQEFLSIIEKCDTHRKKATVLDEFVLFLAFYDDRIELQRWCEELDKVNELKQTEPSSSTYEEKPQPLLNSNDRYKLREFVFNIRNKKVREDTSWKNNKGETRLHEAAKIDNPAELIQLIKSGQDVNAVDHAGWTPLMEAVNHGHLGNVRILCQHKANLNAASVDGLVDEDDKIGPSGITPLMDACSTGKVQIARLLLRFGANASLENEHDETAADMLKNYIENNKMSEIDRKTYSCLLTELEKKTKKRSSDIFASQDPETSDQNIKRFFVGYNFSA